ncbi:hypothetical protein ACKVMT_15660 [Halobacteriales archaeon Cl-PHB]
MVSRSRTAALLLTGLLVVLAGCSGLLGGDDGGQPSGDVAEFAYPDGWSADGIDTLQTALVGHYGAESRGTSFTERLVFRVSQDDTVQRNNSIRYEIDRESREMVARVDGTQRTQVAYFGNGTLTNYDPENESVINSGNASFQKLSNASRLTVGETLNGLDLDASAVVEQGGTTAVEYAVAGVTKNSSFDSASGTVVVASDGRILSLDVTKTKGSQTATYRYVLKAEGSTTVERPSWAKN